jgi:stringent starvation protein B
MPEATSKRPYFIRAMHDWMTDNGLTPYIVVDAGVDGIAVPKNYITDGKIVLNVSFAATRNLIFDKHTVQFEARFEDINHHLKMPMLAVIGIYAKETGQGMIFTDDETPSPTETPVGGNVSGRPSLKVVK